MTSEELVKEKYPHAWQGGIVPKTKRAKYWIFSNTDAPELLGEGTTTSLAWDNALANIKKDKG